MSISEKMDSASGFILLMWQEKVVNTKPCCFKCVKKVELM